eukprot:351936-Chlamydomonas_euryale.AAC.2
MGGALLGPYSGQRASRGGQRTPHKWRSHRHPQCTNARTRRVHRQRVEVRSARQTNSAPTNGTRNTNGTPTNGARTPRRLPPKWCSHSHTNGANTHKCTHTWRAC